jgi:hypothetical protein
LSPGALHLGEVYTQLLSLLLGGLRSVRLLLASSGLLGCLLSLLSCLTSGVLCLLGRLSGLIGDLSGRLLGLPRRLSGGVLHALRDLPDLIGDSAQRTSASLLLAAGEPANGVLGSLHGLTGLIGDLSGRLLSLLGHLSGLIGDLSGRLLGLPRRLSGHILRLLGGSLCGLLNLLLGLLGSLLHRVLDAHVLGRLIHRALEFHVGVDHLLDLGLRVAIGNLLRELLQLGAVILDLALEAAYRLSVEVLGVLRGLLLHLLLKILSLIRHFVSILHIDFRFR